MGINGRVDTEEEKITTHEDTTVESTENETQRNKRLKKKKKRNTAGKVLSSLIFMFWDTLKEVKREKKIEEIIAKISGNQIW